MISRILQSSVDVIPWRWRNRIRSIPLVGSLQRWLTARYLGGRTFVHTITAGPARGVRFRLALPEDKPLWAGTWETELAEAIGKSVQAGDVCLDVGSYRGFFAGVMAVAGASRIHCFEPMPANISRLEEFAALNLQFPVALHALALGAHDGEATFAMMGEPTMGKFADSPFQQGRAPSGTITVKSARLDTLVSSGMVSRPDLIKIDVEGAELDVLAGARDTLASSGARLFIEAHSPALAIACRDELEQLGYSVSVLETGGDVGSASALEICHLIAVRSA